MRKILSILLFLTGALVAPSLALAQGQGLNPVPAWYFASDYGQWDIVSQQPQTYTWSGTNSCQIPKVGGGTFFAFTTGTPVFVRDALNPAHNEVVSVTAPVNTSSACGFTGSFTYTHTSFSVLSATGGLQEGINVLEGSGQPNTGLILNRNWYALLTGLPSYSSATPATILASVTGSSNVVIEDVTTAPFTFYIWNASTSKYVAVAGATGGSAVPTAALGAAAGTAPTLLSTSGNGSVGIVSFTAGTSTTTGTIFTLTWATSGAFPYAPSCTITSVGANQYLTGTSAVVYSASHAVLTFTEATAALTASTAYAFRYSCQ